VLSRGARIHWSARGSGVGTAVGASVASSTDRRAGGTGAVGETSAFSRTTGPVSTEDMRGELSRPLRHGCGGGGSGSLRDGQSGNDTTHCNRVNTPMVPSRRADHTGSSSRGGG